jgi:hypothetical protein
MISVSRRASLFFPQIPPPFAPRTFLFWYLLARRPRRFYPLVLSSYGSSVLVSLERLLLKLSVTLR